MPGVHPGERGELMETLGSIVFVSIAIFALMAVVSYSKRYREYRSGKRLPTSSKDSYDFVEHFALSLWLVLGVVLILALSLNRWWIVAWVLLGGLAAYIVEQLVIAGGLGAFISAGEDVLRDVVNARIAEMNLISSLIEEAPDQLANARDGKRVS